MEMTDTEDPTSLASQLFIFGFWSKMKRPSPMVIEINSTCVSWMAPFPLLNGF